MPGTATITTLPPSGLNPTEGYIESAQIPAMNCRAKHKGKYSFLVLKYYAGEVGIVF